MLRKQYPCGETETHMYGKANYRMFTNPNLYLVLMQNWNKICMVLTYLFVPLYKCMYQYIFVSEKGLYFLRRPTLNWGTCNSVHSLSVTSLRHK